MLAATICLREVGGAYNLGPRDGGAPPPGRITARLQRAQSNLFETLPIFAVAVIVAHIGGREGSLTLAGAWLYLLSRIVYVPLYLMAVPGVRSVAWIAGLVGILYLLLANLF